MRISVAVLKFLSEYIEYEDLTRLRGSLSVHSHSLILESSELHVQLNDQANCLMYMQYYLFVLFVYSLSEILLRGFLLCFLLQNNKMRINKIKKTNSKTRIFFCINMQNLYNPNLFC